MPHLRHVQRQRPTHISGATPASVTNADRAQRVARAIVADAKRGAAMSTNVEQHLAGVGSIQLKTVVLQLFHALAETYAAQRNSAGD
ncbi:MAG: hypothetical protein WBB00_25180 [Mycobacterium sp.]